MLIAEGTGKPAVPFQQHWTRLGQFSTCNSLQTESNEAYGTLRRHFLLLSKLIWTLLSLASATSASIQVVCQADEFRVSFVHPHVAILKVYRTSLTGTVKFADIRSASRLSESVQSSVEVVVRPARIVMSDLEKKGTNKCLSRTDDETPALGVQAAPTCC